jgi:hypothetical protein
LVDQSAKAISTLDAWFGFGKLAGRSVRGA